ncbi:MAG: hypothetical protein LBM26_03800 [Methanobrevibacter sp.]|jgi:hypothetical protein|nr:hypothetical protein [Methanobrevibacter sp.]
MSEEPEIIEKLLKVGNESESKGLSDGQIEAINELVLSGLLSSELVDVLIGIQFQRVSLGTKKELEDGKLNENTESAVENLTQLLMMKFDNENQGLDEEAIEIGHFNI